MNYEIPVNCFTYAEIFLIKNYQWNSMDISITVELQAWICEYVIIGLGEELDLFMDIWSTCIWW